MYAIKKYWWTLDNKTASKVIKDGIKNELDALIEAAAIRQDIVCCFEVITVEDENGNEIYF